MNYQASIRTFILLVLISVCSPVSAEYQAVTKFRYCDLMGGCCDSEEDADRCDDSVSPDKSMVSLHGNDDIDVEACEAIAKNVNEMEKAHYDWEYGFAISANSFDLTLPAWTKASEKEVCDMYSKNDAKPLGIGDCKVAAKYPIYYIPYNLDNSPEDERIYIKAVQFSHGDAKEPLNTAFWAANNDGSQFKSKGYVTDLTRITGDSYPVIYASRLYFIEYGTSIIRDNNASVDYQHTFVVHTFRFPGKESSEKEYMPVCDISPISK